MIADPRVLHDFGDGTVAVAGHYIGAKQSRSLSRMSLDELLHAECEYDYSPTSQGYCGAYFARVIYKELTSSVTNDPRVMHDFGDGTVAVIGYHVGPTQRRSPNRSDLRFLIDANRNLELERALGDPTYCGPCGGFFTRVRYEELPPLVTPATIEAVRAADPLREAKELVKDWETARDAFHAVPGAIDFNHSFDAKLSAAWSTVLREKVEASKKVDVDRGVTVVVDNDMDHLLKDEP